MSFNVNGSLVLLALLIPAVLIAAIATVPRWFIRSMSKHALWRLRDAVVDDVIAGRLPSNDPAVQELVARIEWAIGESRSFDLLHLVVWNRAKNRLSKETLRTLVAVPDLKKLTQDQASIVTGYRTRFDSVAIRAILLSSWLGVALVLWTVVPLVLRELVHRRYRQRAFGVVVREAATEAAEETHFGRLARDYVDAKSPGLKPLPVAA